MKILIFVVFVFVVSPVFAQDGDRWIHIGSSGKAKAIYVDSESFQSQGQKRLFWFKVEMIDDFVIRQHVLIDCLDRAYSFDRMYVSKPDGTSEDLATESSKKPLPVIPDSLMETVLNSSCGNYNQKLDAKDPLPLR